MHIKLFLLYNIVITNVKCNVLYRAKSDEKNIIVN